MIINGTERKFFLSVGASCAIADLCPDGDLANIGQLFGGRIGDGMRTIAKIIVALNRGYEDRVHPDAEKPNYVTVKELMSLSMDEFHQAEAEAFEAYFSGSKTQVELTDPKGSKKNEASAES